MVELTFYYYLLPANTKASVLIGSDFGCERRKGEFKLARPSAWRSTTVAGDGPARVSSLSSYRSGRSPHWLKAKNPKSPAARREALEDCGRRRLWRF